MDPISSAVAATSIPQRRDHAERGLVRDCVWIAIAAGAFTLLVWPFQNAPFVDDWVYAFSVETLLKSGRLLILDNSSHINVAQVLWGSLLCLPFGFSFVALGVSTWLLAVGGLLALYVLLRDLDVPRLDAMLGTAALGFYPIFAMLGVTFMTDVPFVSLTVVASFAFVRATRDRNLRWLIVAAIFASLAVATRVVGLVTPIAMFLAMLLSRDDWGRRGRHWAVTLVPLAVFAVVAHWYRSHVYHVADLTWIENTPQWRIARLKFALPLLPQMIGSTLGLLAGCLGLPLLPLSIAQLRRSTLRRTLMILGALTVALLAWYAAGIRYALPLETGQTWALDELGLSSLLVPGYRVDPVPSAVCWAGFAVGTASLASAAASLRKPSWKAGDLFLLLAIAGHCGLIALLWLFHDHYLLVIVPYAIAVMLSAHPPLRRRQAVIALTLVALITCAGIKDQRSYSRALWQAVGTLRRAGVPAGDINGGWMVNGWLQYAHPEQAYRDAQGSIDIPWVNGSAQRPYMVANASSDGWQVLARFGYERWLGPSGQIYVLKLSPNSEQAP
jgi:hypothetical protein